MYEVIKIKILQYQLVCFYTNNGLNFLLSLFISLIIFSLKEAHNIVWCVQFNDKKCTTVQGVIKFNFIIADLTQ